MTKYINTFPGYEHIPGPENKGKGRNMYRGVDLGFGGYVYAEPGIYTNVALLDAGSMHPTSIIALNKLGKYTKRYADLRAARLFIKHHDYDSAGELFDGKLKKYLTSEDEADNLSKSIKLPLNQFFGISFSDYDMPTVDSRDVNNIIALRGALFMKTLQDELNAMGQPVVHIKTDSCKLPNATPEIIKFVQDFGKKYGYEMEHEATYDRMCLINGSTYIAKYDDKGVRNKGGKHAGQWVAVAEQFQVPYIFKTLFSREPLTFKDFCEVKSVKEGDIYLDMNEDLPDVSEEEKQLKKLQTKYRKGELSDTTYEKESRPLEEQISKGHNYVFVGKVGQFCPIKDGCGGGVMYRYADGKYYAVAGTKGYRWLESEVVRKMQRESDINEDYYKRLADDAIDAINKYGDFYHFIADEPYICDLFNVRNDDELPINKPE